MNSMINQIVNILCMRERLNELMQHSENLLDPKIMHTSQLLDHLLNNYHRTITKTNKDTDNC
jgi:iron-sulfur cluster repair protein YtfE (RIC family)